MLDGLLGRSAFFTKCKSLIKQTRTRIDVVRRKRSATQKFLRKDIADLLANGLETNAYGRADGLVSELILSSCYDFIDHVCEIILKHLPVLQKLRDCPEDCREAVASLMFAAARFSDLPELRELRDLFQARYGSSLEYYVNQKLVDNLTSKPPSMEKNIQLLQEIATEFSLRWDRRGFEERMDKSSINEQKHQRTPETRHTAQSKSSTPRAEDLIERNIKDEALSKKRSEGSYQARERQPEGRHKMETRRENILEREVEPKQNVPKASNLPNNSYKPPLHKEGSIQKREDHDNYLQRRQQKAERRVYEEDFAKEAIQGGRTSNGKHLESFDRQVKDLRSISNGKSSPSDLKNEPSENIHVKSMRKMQEDMNDGLKSNFRGGFPPPYVKPRKSKHKVDDDENDTLTFYPPGNGNRAETLPTQSPDARENGNGVGGFTEIYYKDESGIESTPRRRSHRRRHSRSSSTQDVNGDSGKEERVVRRVSTSRRKHESRKGLQVLFDDDHFEKDDEERMIDKLLLHYSKKPSSSDNPGKSRKESKTRTTNEAMKSPVYNNKIEVVNDRDEEDSTPRKETSRSMSFPPRQVSQPETTKVFARAASFQPDTPAKHVHPKLPDYDDLAARFAALRATKG